MRAVFASIVLMLVLTVSGASARGDATISGSDWRALVSGKTLHFQRLGKPAGKMYFLSRSTNFVFIDAAGKCFKGWFNGRYDEVKYHYIGRRKPGVYVHTQAGSSYLLKDQKGDADLKVVKITQERLRCRTTAKERERQKELLKRLAEPKKRVPGFPVAEVIDAMSGNVGPVFFGPPHGPRGGLKITLRAPRVEKVQAIDVMRRLCAARDRGKRLGDASTIEIVNTSGKQGFKHYSGVRACNPGSGVSRDVSIGLLGKI